MSYAKGTSVPKERSRAEVEMILTKYGADQVSSGFTAEKAVVMFRMKHRYIRIDLPLPKRGDPKTPNWQRSPKDKLTYYDMAKADQEERRRWRAMVLYVKAKLESVESNIVSFEQAFMGHLVLPNKQTVSEFMQPQIEAAYQGGNMPKALPGY